jgi:hypothetical protein
LPIKAAIYAGAEYIYYEDNIIVGDESNGGE